MATEYAVTKYDYDENGNCIYKGQHRAPGADEDDIYWIITKYGYDVNGNCEDKSMRTGSWTGRTSGW